MIANDLPLHVASRLAGHPCDMAEPVRRGGNNRIFRIAGAGKQYALKYYPPQTEDRRDRLTQEFNALLFLRQQGVTCVPSPIARDPAHHAALYHWIAGTPPASCGPDELEALLTFMADLHRLRHQPEAKNLPSASAACFSWQAATTQWQERLNRLTSVAPEWPELTHFLTQQLLPTWKRLEHAPPFQSENDPLPARHRTLSPSDFGCHNALRSAGQLFFLDLEYFGWDDPVKLTADLWWHPGSSWPPPLRRTLPERAATLYEGDGDRHFSQRLQERLPLFGLIWSLILLNEFLPERWTRRTLAGITQPRQEILLQQLRKSADCLHTVHHLLDERP